MFSKFIDFRIFLISLAFGLFLIYMTNPSPTVIYVYPTPENINKIQIKDTLDNCYHFSAKEVTCPSDESKIHTIPVQSYENSI